MENIKKFWVVFYYYPNDCCGGSAEKVVVGYAKTSEGREYLITREEARQISKHGTVEYPVDFEEETFID